jgi:chromosome partitioning protein
VRQRTRGPWRVAVANQKGGVGKSTIAVNLAVGLARRMGDAVLIVDLDPQANATVALIGQQEPTATVYDLLVNAMPAREAIVQVEPRLDLLPATLDLAAAEVELLSEVGGQLRLKTRLAEIQANYEAVVIDCPPSLGLLTINALAASDRVLVPIVPGVFSLKGLSELQRTVEKVRSNLNCPGLALGAIVLNMADHTRVCADVRQALEDRYGQLVMKTELPRSVRFEEANSRPGQSIFGHAASSPAAEAMQSFIKELLSHE